MRIVCVLLKYRGPSLLEHWERCFSSSSKHNEFLSSLWCWNGSSLSVRLRLTAPVLDGAKEGVEEARLSPTGSLSCFSSGCFAEWLSGWSTSFICELSLWCRAMSGGFREDRRQWRRHVSSWALTLAPDMALESTIVVTWMKPVHPLRPVQKIRPKNRAQTSQRCRFCQDKWARSGVDSCAGSFMRLSFGTALTLPYSQRCTTVDV